MHMEARPARPIYANSIQEQNQKRKMHGSHYLLLTILFCGILGLLCNACSSNQTNTTTTTQQSSVTASPSTQSTTTGLTPTSTPLPASSTQSTVSIPIKVYFSKSDQSNNSSVVGVERTSPTEAVGTYAIEQLIAGPTSTEKGQGYYSQLQEALVGDSNCSGQNFQLVLNSKGQVTEQGTATITFCREIQSAGIGTDAAIIAEVSTTLEQFSSIKKVVILTQSGHCFGDESNSDQCLQ